MLLKPSTTNVGRSALDRGDALRAVGEVERFVQVVGQHADHFAEAQRDDGQVVAAHAQHRQAQEQARQAGDDDAQEDEQVEAVAGQQEGQVRRLGAGRKRQHVVLLGAEEGPQVGAHRIEGHIAQVQQSGEPHHDIQPQRQGGKHADLEDDFQVEDVAHAQAPA